MVANEEIVKCLERLGVGERGQVESIEGLEESLSFRANGLRLIGSEEWEHGISYPLGCEFHAFTEKKTPFDARHLIFCMGPRRDHY